jgi:hypothetical protein
LSTTRSCSARTDESSGDFIAVADVKKAAGQWLVRTSNKLERRPDNKEDLVVRCFLRVRGAAGAFYEAGFADSGDVFQGEVDAARWVDIGATFSAAVFVVAIIAVIV